MAVPSARLARLARFGGLATGIAGDVLWQGARQLASGQRPSMGDLLLTPANALKVTNQLAQMRGAAMKVGQLISMDAGELLPAELADILSRLRADAHPMPGGQLKAVLTANWGENWLRRFERFDVRPLAAASIGQVHRARTRDGRDLAIKIQYPGVRRSIDSDVTNVAALIRLSGLLPASLDIAPMLAEARRQLHEESDYLREGACLRRFSELLDGEADFVVPVLQDDLTTRDVLAMTYVEGVPVESLATAPQAERDRVVTLLIGLMFRELFTFRVMQTDPNFANYRYNPATGQVVLLDFGATRDFAPGIVEDHRGLLLAGLSGKREALRAAAVRLGFLAPDSLAKHVEPILDMMEMAFAPLRRPEPFDFGTSDLAIRMRDGGMALNRDRDFWQIPPMDTLFLQRKFGGIYLLATRLKARVDLGQVLSSYLAPDLAA